MLRWQPRVPEGPRPQAMSHKWFDTDSSGGAGREALACGRPDFEPVARVGCRGQVQNAIGCGRPEWARQACRPVLPVAGARYSTSALREGLKVTMRPNQQNNNNNNKNRQRGRNNNGGRKHINPLSRNFESNGPDVKVRGNASHIAEKYLQLARDAQSSGNSVMAENYLQHAEHYYRIVSAAQPQERAPRQDQFGNDRWRRRRRFPAHQRSLLLTRAAHQLQQPEPQRQPAQQPGSRSSNPRPSRRTCGREAVARPSTPRPSAMPTTEAGGARAGRGRGPTASNAAIAIGRPAVAAAARRRRGVKAAIQPMRRSLTSANSRPS